MQNLALVRGDRGAAAGLSPCDHRSVSKGGRIVCGKIVEGPDEVTPEVCRACPTRAVNCRHLRFSLRQVAPQPLVVRYNGRTELWDDDPPEVRFEQAACAAKVSPIQHPRQCAGCSLRSPLQGPAAQQHRPVTEQRLQRRAATGGKVVAFPLREVPAAAG